MRTNNNTKPPKISKRETEVLHLLADGNSRKMIAEELQLKDNTVHSYFKIIYRKLNVNSATSALRVFFNRKKS
jgi:DNA-binding NarL/FixJ family response regulator